LLNAIVIARCTRHHVNHHRAATVVIAACVGGGELLGEGEWDGRAGEEAADIDHSQLLRGLFSRLP
jgi:hypothetical protein